MRLIDIKRASELRQGGLTYKQVGEALALEKGRVSPYKAESVYKAMLQYRKELGMMRQTPKRKFTPRIQAIRPDMSGC